MAAFIHEPFYDIDHYFNSFLHNIPKFLIHRPKQNSQTGDGTVVRALKPRYARISTHIVLSPYHLVVYAEWTSTRTQKSRPSPPHSSSWGSRKKNLRDARLAISHLKTGNS